MSRAPIASVIVPAHDEQDVIVDTLTTLLAGAGPDELEVVVVCNGCRDRTAARAASVPGVRVVEIATASKIAALRAGDDAATTFPRVYLDGDTRLRVGAVRALVDALARPGVHAAGVRASLDLTGTSRPARWFYGFRQQLPVFASGFIGAGVYAVDADGHARLGGWPDVVADDQLVLRTFPPAERATVEGHRSVVTVAPDLPSVVRRGVRVRRGNQQLGAADGPVGLPAPPSGAGTALRRCLARPTTWLPAATWVLVSAYIRLRARLGGGGDWVAERGAGAGAAR